MMANPQYDALCSVCQEFSNNQFRHEIETSLAQLRQSTDSCHFCNLLYRSRHLRWYGSLRPLQTNDYDVLEAEQYQNARLSVRKTSHEEMSDSKFLAGFVGSVEVKVKFLNVDSDTRERILQQRYASGRNDIESKIESIKTWTQTCCQDHDVCRDNWQITSSQRRLPTRLLDVGTIMGPSLHLVETETMSPLTDYIALSHCWGPKQYIKLTTKTFKDFGTSIPWDALSRTFQDAIDVTRRLDQRYIWIDSLCIIQDSQDDWLREASLMGKVYSQSLLTIAATASSDGTGGLFHDNDPFSAQGCLIETTKTESKEWLHAFLVPDHIWRDRVETAPLGKRGWVVQERILPPRVLHFSSAGLLWECCEGLALQSLPTKPKHWLSFDGAANQKKALHIRNPTNPHWSDSPIIVNKWHAIVSKYTECLLSFPSDKSIAIAGIASRTSKQLGVPPSAYLAGLWELEMPHELLWYTRSHAIPSARFPHRAPSWSWMSLDAPITWPQAVPGSRNVMGFSLGPDPDDFFGIYDTTATLIEYTAPHDLTEGTAFGAVAGTALVLRGPLFPVEWLYREESYNYNTPPDAEPGFFFKYKTELPRTDAERNTDLDARLDVHGKPLKGVIKRQDNIAWDCVPTPEQASLKGLLFLGVRTSLVVSSGGARYLPDVLLEGLVLEEVVGVSAGGETEMGESRRGRRCFRRVGTWRDRSFPDAFVQGLVREGREWVERERQGKGVRMEGDAEGEGGRGELVVLV